MKHAHLQWTKAFNAATVGFLHLASIWPLMPALLSQKTALMTDSVHACTPYGRCAWWRGTSAPRTRYLKDSFGGYHRLVLLFVLGRGSMHQITIVPLQLVARRPESVSAFRYFSRVIARSPLI